MTGFLEVVLRGVVLSGLAVAVGGVAFVLFVLRSARPPAAGRSLALIAVGGLATAGAQAVAVALDLAALADSRGWPLAAMAATTYFRASLVHVVAGAALALAATRARAHAAARPPLLLVCATLLIVTSTAMSHAAGRVHDRELLLPLDALHQLGATVWVGGLVHLMVGARAAGSDVTGVVLRRFSALAVGSVATLLAGGLGLAVYYVDGVGAVIGTSYGFMVMTKVVMLGGLLVMGGLNFVGARRLPADAPAPPGRVRRLVEAEVGLGLTVLFAASSLTALPPAVDIVADRATPAELARVLTPKWPRLTSPALAEMPIADRDAPRTDADRAWSEYNHNVAGLFVLAMGLLACVQRVRGLRWARHWPLIFLGLAAFLLVRNDPGAWPLGPLGFWESMGYAEVLQHRIFVLLVVVFGLFEWTVRTGRLRSKGYALVFPLLCAVGSALLVTHSHALNSLKSEFLVEALHAPLALAGMVVAWARWLELRLPPPDDRLPARLWPVALAVVGALLVVYRET